MPETVESLKEMFDKVYDSSEYKTRRDRWKRYLKQYMNEYWNEIGMDPSESKVSFNMLFSTVETNAPLLTDNKPMWTVLARWPHQQKIADNITLASRAIWDKLEIDMLLLRAVKDSQLFGKGIFKVYFSPESDEIKLEVIDPATFVISPGYDDLWDASWCGQKRRLPLDWIARAYPDKVDEIQASEAQDKEDEGLWPRDEIELESDFVTVYEVWMRDDSVEKISDVNEDGETVKTEQPKYPNGRIITFTDNNILLDDRPSPFNHGKPPYVDIDDYPVPHRFWSMGEPDQIEAMVREQNLRLQQVVDTARKYDKKNYILSKAAGIKRDVFTQAIRTGDNVMIASDEFHKDMLAEVPPPSLDTATLNLLDILPRYIEEVTGVTDVTKGTIGKKSRQSASEISVLMESSYTRTRQRVRNLEWSIKRLLTLIIEIMQQYYIEPRPYQIKKDDGVEYGFISNDPKFVAEQMRPQNIPSGMPEESLAPEDKQALEDYRKILEDFMDSEEVAIKFELQIDTNSTLPLDKQSLANLAMRLAENKVLPEEALLEILRFPNKERYTRMLEERRKEAIAAKQGGAPGPQGPPTPQEQMMAQMQKGQ